MGIAPFGDPDKYDLTSLAKFNGRRLKINNHLVGTVGIRRYKAQSKGHYFSRQLVDMLGPRRVGNLVDDPLRALRGRYSSTVRKPRGKNSEKLFRRHDSRNRSSRCSRHKLAEY